MILENFVELRRIASTSEELLKAIAKAATLASWVQWIHVSLEGQSQNPRTDYICVGMAFVSYVHVPGFQMF
jgi:hypothetical protein